MNGILLSGGNYDGLLTFLFITLFVSTVIVLYPTIF